jgi:hypothetical protein
MEQAFVSLSGLAERTGCSASQIVKAAQKVRPDLWLDSVPYWTEERVPAMRKVLGLEPADDEPEKWIRAAKSPAPAREIRLTAAGEVSLTAASSGGARVRRFEMTAYTGGAMRVRGFSSPIVIDLEGMSGIAGSRPIYLNHDPEKLVGHADQITIQGSNLLAAGVVSGGGAAAQEVTAANDAGFPWQASVGAAILKSEELPTGRTAVVNGNTITGPATIARKSRLGEISFVPLGADDQTAARIAARKKTPHMAKAITRKANPKPAPVLAAAAADDLDDELELELDAGEELQAERDRVTKIAKAVSRLAASSPAATEKLAEIQAAAVSEGWSAEKAELKLIRAARMVHAPMIGAGGNGAAGLDPAGVLEASFAMSMGASGKGLEAQSVDKRIIDAASDRRNRGATLHSLIRAIIASGTGEMPASIGDREIRTAFQLSQRNVQAGDFGGVSTLSLPGILSNSMNKVLLEAYGAVATAWGQIAAPADLKDFKPATRYRMIGIGKFEKVGPGGEIKSITLTEQTYSNQLDTKGALIGISRQMIINDDMGAFQQLPSILGRLAAVGLESAVFTLLLSNPGSFFSAGNSNLATGAGSALSVTSLGTAIQKFRDQVDDNGDPVLITPSVLLVPTALEFTAKSIIRSQELRDGGSTTKYTTGNPFSNDLEPVVSPYLSNAKITGNSSTAWYVFGAPGDVGAMEVGFLRGGRAPTIENGELDFNKLGIAMRGFFDFGVAMRDYRAAVKSNGA